MRPWLRGGHPACQDRAAGSDQEASLLSVATLGAQEAMEGRATDEGVGSPGRTTRPNPPLPWSQGAQPAPSALSSDSKHILGSGLSGHGCME